jgi:ribonuclease HI
MRLSIYADGASRGNPGPGAIGAIVLGERDEELARISQSIGLTTNNQAEYKAVIAAIKTASKFNAAEAILYLDSQLVVNQLIGKYKIKNTSLQSLYAEAIKQIKGFKKLTIVHIPREKNKIADALANAALWKGEI